MEMTCKCLQSLNLDDIRSRLHHLLSCFSPRMCMSGSDCRDAEQGAFLCADSKACSQKGAFLLQNHLSCLSHHTITCAKNNRRKPNSRSAKSPLCTRLSRQGLLTKHFCSLFLQLLAHDQGCKLLSSTSNKSHLCFSQS